MTTAPLADQSTTGFQPGTASAYARKLLASLGHAPDVTLQLSDEYPALAWARSGLMALTGEANGKPQMCPVPLAACADGALAALASLAPVNALQDIRGSRLLAERAAIAGFSRNGTASPGGACRLLQAADGWIAVNFARPDDWELVPAWLEAEVMPDWESVARIVRKKWAAELIERCRLLGLAAALDEMPVTDADSWYSVISPSPRRKPGSILKMDSVPGLRRDRPLSRRNDKKKAMPLVVDLSSLWAGPLCTHLLQQLGARVIKVEHPHRPDGARHGPQDFYNLLNAQKQCVTLHAGTPDGRDQLLALLGAADIVIEGSRPRALRQLGIEAEAVLERNPSLTWVSITGYGRGEPQENWIAYGDDAGVAAGLSQLMHYASGRHLIVGDAIADPLTGIHAALAAWSGWQSGGGQLLSLALRNVVEYCIQFDLPDSAPAIRQRFLDWSNLVAQSDCADYPSPPRTPPGPAHALGADTSSVLAEFGIPC